MAEHTAPDTDLPQEIRRLGPVLARLATALEQLAPCPAPMPDWLGAPAYIWGRDGAQPVARLDAPALELLCGIDQQKGFIATNIARHAAGHAAHDMLLWGARGMGKSALVRASVLAAGNIGSPPLALVQVAPDALDRLGGLFAQLAPVARQFLVFIDDLGFDEADLAGPRALRSWLEGGVAARPANIRLAVTSNRRAIVGRNLGEQDDPINPRDVVDDKLALADRFGLSIGFHACSQEDYLAMLQAYCAQYGLPLDQGDALEWSKRRGSRSGRIAWHYVQELAGRAGRMI